MVETGLSALDEPMSWYPDGKQLAYTRLVAREELPERAPGLDYFGTYFGHVWNELPAIYVYDVSSGKSEFFWVGWRAVVSSDGRTILVGGWNDEGCVWRKVDLATGKHSALSPAGRDGRSPRPDCRSTGSVCRPADNRRGRDIHPSTTAPFPGPNPC